MTQNYTYDAFNRLLTAGEVSGWSQSYGYDAFGNQKVTTSGYNTSQYIPTASATYNTKNQLTNSGGGATAGYDNAGNQTALGGFGNTFDAENRMVKSTINTHDTNYTYDGEGNQGQTRRFLRSIPPAADAANGSGATASLTLNCWH